MVSSVIVYTMLGGLLAMILCSPFIK